MTIEHLHHIFLDHRTPCTDTRKITEGCLFFALKGPYFNGNAFAHEALDKGAAYAIIDEPEYKMSERTILVTDVLATLQELGAYHRKQSRARVIALTGSNGKTTTKELIHAVLSKKYLTIATEGNLNNHIGVPLTLLSIQDDTEIAIVEMGANHLGEIAFLSGLARPDFGYITNFGKAHLEGFGGPEGVIKGKSELYTHIMERGGHLFMNADDPVQKEKLAHYIQKIGYSQNDPQYYQIQLLGADPYLCIKADDTEIRTQLIGRYNFGNCAAAIIMGKYFNVPMMAIEEAIASYRPENNRSQILSKNGYEIILDAYNANPSSMRAALENLDHMAHATKTVFLGDMFELGETAAAEHQAIASLLDEYAFSAIYLVGKLFSQTRSSGRTFETFAELEAHIKDQKPPQGTVLIKGSRGMAMERILNLL